MDVATVQELNRSVEAAPHADHRGGRGGGCWPPPAAPRPPPTPGKSGNSGKIGGKLLIDNESGSTWTCQFNPFNPSVNITSIGFVYEPLEFVNILQTNPDGTPEGHVRGSPPGSLGAAALRADHDHRSGVTWSDGSPFSANDVLYTFNALKADPALDLNALWAVNSGPLTSVALQGTQPGRLHLQRGGAVVLLLRRRSDAHHSPAHLG